MMDLSLKEAFFPPPSIPYIKGDKGTMSTIVNRNKWRVKIITLLVSEFLLSGTRDRCVEGRNYGT